MDNIKLKQRIESLLQAQEKCWDSEHNEVNLSQLLHLLEQRHVDPDLMRLFLSDNAIRERFFQKVDNAYIFQTNDFRFFMDEHKIDNSFTAYKNRIGLSDGKRYLRDTNNVVLNWPFKDCVLEGGQSSEEGEDVTYEPLKDSENYEEKSEKRKEIFYNEVLAQEEIDRLFDPKALTGWKRYSENGEERPLTIRRDSTGIIRENLIIKGNNLLALHSLKHQFAGTIKLIYIDPPYNTDSAANTFRYNNNFNHSTWLTFMKNRLEVARIMLKDDGIIIIDIDHNELFYLGVLCDEIFGRNNRLGVLAIQHNPGGRDNEFFANSHENKLVYAKNKDLAKINMLELSEEETKKKYPKKDEISRYYEMGLQRTGDNSKREARPNLFYPIYYSEKNNEISLEKKEGYTELWPIDDEGIERTWRWGKKKVNEEWKTEIFVRDSNGKYKIFTKSRDSGIGGKKPKTLWVDSKHAGTSGTSSLKHIFGEKVFTYPKSPFMVKDTILIASDPGDIVLDYHLGSGTTASVVHKLGRQYIGIEQMDYIQPVAVERMKAVINGEQGGISESLGWEGGGSFVYCELAPFNETAKAQIANCASLQELGQLFETLRSRYFLHYNFHIQEFTEKVIQEHAFRSLPLAQQKQMFTAMLDNNQLYVNASEMADSKYGISKEDQALTEEFYGKK